MKLVYLDTSAAMKLAIDEAESEALLAFLTTDADLTLVASWLLHTELHCALGRRPLEFSDELVRQVIDPVELVDVTRRDFIVAGRLAPLRSNDAIHLAVAMRLQVEEFVSYDRELLKAARRVGLSAISPGALA